MGKDKHANRTKGNQKPSSSGRSAELLGTTGTFQGFGKTVTSSSALIPSNGDVTDVYLDNGLKLVFRKMAKKDSTTKIKALQEFEEVLSSEEADVLTTGLKYWTRLFKKLSIDFDKRVREMCIRCHCSLSSKVGKQMAPFLHDTIPYWLLTMCDTYSAVANEAAKGFKSVFSEEKQCGVLLHCTKPITDLIFNHLFIDTPDTLSDVKSSTDTEREDKYIRVICCSLKALALLHTSTRLHKDFDSNVLPQINRILEKEEFFALHKHPNSDVRCFFFECLSILSSSKVCHVEKFSVAIRKGMSDSDSDVITQVLNALLCLAKSAPSCWDYLGTNSAKPIHNKIIKIVEEGEKGVAIAPNLLPLLSVSPPSFPFYSSLLSALTKCLLNRELLNGKVQYHAMLNALFECLRFISRHRSPDKVFWSEVFETVLMPLFSLSLQPHLHIKEGTLHEKIVQLLIYWSKQMKSPSSDDTNSSQYFRELIDLFWGTCFGKCIAVLSSSEDKKVLKELAGFIITIREPKRHSKSKRTGVKFASDSTDKQEDDSLFENVYLEDQFSTVVPNIQELINKSLELFKSNSVWCVLVVYCECLQTFSASIPVTFSILEQEILPQFDREDSPSLAYASEFFLNHLVTLPEKEQMKLLGSFLYSCSVNALYNLLRSCSSPALQCSSSSLTNWLQGPSLGSKVVSLLSQLLSLTAGLSMEAEADSSAALQKTRSDTLQLVELCQLVFGEEEHSAAGFCLSTQYISQMLMVLEGSVPEEVPDDSDDPKLSVLKLVIELSQSIFLSTKCWKLPQCSNLLISFVKLLCNSSDEDDADLMKMITEVKSLVIDAVKFLVVHVNNGQEEITKEYSKCVEECFTLIKKAVEEEDCSVNSALSLSDLSSKILMAMSEETAEDSDIPLDHHRVRFALDILMTSDEVLVGVESKLSPLYVLPYLLSGAYMFRNAPCSRDITIGERLHTLPDYVKIALFWSKILVILTGTEITQTVAEDIAETRQGNIDSILALASGVRVSSLEYSAMSNDLNLGPFTRLVMICYHASVYHDTCNKYRKSLNLATSENIHDDLLENLVENTSALIKRLNIGNLQQVCKYICTKAVEDTSGKWCVTLSTLLSSIHSSVSVGKLYSSVSEIGFNATLVKQIITPYLEAKDMRSQCDSFFSSIPALMDDPFSGVDGIAILSTYLNHAKLNGEVRFKVENVLDLVLSWLEQGDTLFFSDSPDSFEDSHVVSSIMYLLSLLINEYSMYFKHEHWDRILCAVVTWVQNSQTKVKEDDIDLNTSSSMMLSAVCKCIAALYKLLGSLTDNDVKAGGVYPENLLDEWKGFYSSTINESFLDIFFILSSNYETEGNRCLLLYLVCRSLSEYAYTLTAEDVLEIPLTTFLKNIKQENNKQQIKLSENLQLLVDYLCKGLTSPHPHIVGACFKMLHVTLPQIMTEWVEKSTSFTDKPLEKIKFDDIKVEMPYALLSVVQHCGSIVQSALWERENLSGYSIVVPHTDSFTYTTAYLLSWHLVCLSLSSLDEAQKRLISEHLNSEVPMLLSLLMKLLPPSFQFPRHSGRVKENMLSSQFDFSFQVCSSSYSIWWLSCQLYLQCMDLFPSWSRRWFTNSPRHHSEAISKYTTTHFAPVHLEKQFAQLRSYTDECVSISISSRKEVKATYCVDETSLPMTLSIPSNFPLTSASVITLDDGVNKKVIDNWKMGLKTSLDLKNSSLLNSLILWKNNLDQKYSGVEPCYICYSVVHLNNHNLPNAQCRTCKKKFHSACMYTWFISSTKSECPLCRSIW